MISFSLVGLLGIEPSLSAPKADVLPVYYSPMIFMTFKTEVNCNIKEEIGQSVAAIGYNTLYEKDL